MDKLTKMYKYSLKVLVGVVCVFAFACGNAETGGESGKENREDQEDLNRGTEGNDAGIPSVKDNSDREDNDDENPNGTITADSLNTDTSSIRVDNSQ